MTEGEEILAVAQRFQDSADWMLRGALRPGGGGFTPLDLERAAAILRAHARPLVAAFGFRVDVSKEGVATFDFFGDRLEALSDDRRERLQAAMQAMADVVREHLVAQRG